LQAPEYPEDDIFLSELRGMMTQINPESVLTAEDYIDIDIDEQCNIQQECWLVLLCLLL